MINLMKYVFVFIAIFLGNKSVFSNSYDVRLFCSGGKSGKQVIRPLHEETKATYSSQKKKYIIPENEFYKIMFDNDCDTVFAQAKSACCLSKKLQAIADQKKSLIFFDNNNLENSDKLRRKINGEKRFGDDVKIFTSPNGEHVELRRIGRKYPSDSFGKLEDLEALEHIEIAFDKIVLLARSLNIRQMEDLTFIINEDVDNRQKLDFISRVKYYKNHYYNVEKFIESYTADISTSEMYIGLFANVTPARREVFYLLSHFRNQARISSSMNSKRAEILGKFYQEVSDTLGRAIKYKPVVKRLPKEQEALGRQEESKPQEMNRVSSQEDESLPKGPKLKRRGKGNEDFPAMAGEESKSPDESAAAVHWLPRNNVASVLDRLRAEEPKLSEIYDQLMADVIPQKGLPITNKDVEKLFKKIAELQSDYVSESNLEEKCLSHQHAVHTKGHSKGHLPRSWALHLRLSLIKYGIFADDFEGKTFKEIAECENYARKHSEKLKGIDQIKKELDKI